MWSSYLIFYFYHLIKDFIINWKCSRKEATPWKEPHICGISQTKLYIESGLESLNTRRWSRRFCYYDEFKCYGVSPYLFQLIPQEIHSYNTRNSENIPTYHCRTDLFKHSFFPQTIRERNKLAIDISKST